MKTVKHILEALVLIPFFTACGFFVVIITVSAFRCANTLLTGGNPEIIEWVGAIIICLIIGVLCFAWYLTDTMIDS